MVAAFPGVYAVIRDGQVYLSGLPPELVPAVNKLGVFLGRDMDMGRTFIDAVITKDGKTKLSVRGAKGGECLSLTEAVEKRIGTVESREYTPERYNELRSDQQEPLRVYRRTP